MCLVIEYYINQPVIKIEILTTLMNKKLYWVLH